MICWSDHSLLHHCCPALGCHESHCGLRVLLLLVVDRNGLEQLCMLPVACAGTVEQG